MNMKKKNIVLSVLLSVCVFVVGVGVSPIYAFASNQGMVSLDSIGSATTYLEKKSSSTLSYRVTASPLAISSSVTAKIVLQKNESSKWVNKETVNRTEKNVSWFDVSGTINVKSYGSGNYRIMVKVSDVYNGMTSTFGPIYSDTVTI